MALLGADARIRARGVDEGDEGKPKLLGHAHESKRLSVALGMRAAEIAVQIFLHVTALLLADDHAANAADGGEPAGHRGIVAEEAVAFEFHKVGAGHANIIEEKRAGDVARNLNALPGIEVAVDVPAGRLDLSLHALDLAAEVDFPLLGLTPEFAELLLQLQDGFFKIQSLHIHGPIS